MVKERVDIIYTVKDLASKGVNKLKGGVIKLAKVGILGTTAALVGFAALMKKASGLASIQEDAVNNLTAAMKNNGTFTRESVKDATDFASALQKQTIFGDEAIIGAQSLLVSLGNLSGEGLNNATQATLDLSARLGIDLKSAASLVGKSVGSSTNALARYGIEVKGAVGSQERLNSLVENAATLFGGAAQAQAETFSGKVQQLKNAFGDMLEVVGQATNEGLKPFIQSLTNIIQFATKNLPKLIISFKPVFIDIIALIKINVAIMKELIAYPFRFSTYKTIFLELVKRVTQLFKAMHSIAKKGLKGLLAFRKQILKEEEKDSRTLAQKIVDIRKAAEEKKKELLLGTLEKDKQIKDKQEDNADALAAAEIRIAREKQEKLKADRQKSVTEQLKGIKELQTNIKDLSKEELEFKLANLDKFAEEFKGNRDLLLKIEKSRLKLQEQFEKLQVKKNQELLKSWVSNFEAAGQERISIGEQIAKGTLHFAKKAIKAEIDAWGAKEVAKAWAAAPLSFGFSLLALAPIALAVAGGRAAVDAIKLQQGGLIKAQAAGTLTQVAGRPAIVGEGAQDEIVMPLDRIGEIIPNELILRTSDGQHLAKLMWEHQNTLLRTGQISGR